MTFFSTSCSLAAVSTCALLQWSAAAATMKLHELDSDLVMCHIGHFLRMKEYVTLSLTSKHLYEQLRFRSTEQNAQLLYVSGNVNQIFFRQTGITFFGSEEWETTFGVRNLEHVVLLSLDAFHAIHAQCPFSPTGKLVKDTHALVYVPARIPTATGDEAVTFPVLGRLCPSILQDPDASAWGGDLREMLLAQEQPNDEAIPDDEPGCPNYRWGVDGLCFVDCGTGADLAISGSGWLLFFIGEDHAIIPGSRGASYTDSLQLLRAANQLVDAGSVLGRNGELLAGEGYEVLGALEVAIVAALVLSVTHQRILPRDPKTFAITKYIAKGYNRTIIGDSNDETGLFGYYHVSGNEQIGVCAARRLKPALPAG
jgi:hypothetical protein